MTLSGRGVRIACDSVNLANAMQPGSEVKVRPRGRAPSAIPCIDFLPEPGELIGGKYQVLAEIGSGPMGLTVLAADARHHRQLAVKLLISPLRDPVLEQRFLTRAGELALIWHPRVVSIFAVGDHFGIPYFVMEYMKGGTLAEWLADVSRDQAVETAVRILDDACRGVSALHDTGTVHGNIKPSNVLLDDRLRACVGDFGLVARTFDQHKETEIAGASAAYTAPEAYFGPGTLESATPQSDVYALACIAYELLTGRPPFVGETELAMTLRHAMEVPLPPSVVKPGLSIAYDRVLLRALAKKPEERIQTAEELRLSLEQAHRLSLSALRVPVAEEVAELGRFLARKLAADAADALIA